MLVTIKTKSGSEKFDTEDLLNKNGNLYESLKNYFFDWLDNFASAEVKEMYTEPLEEYNGGTYFDWKGGIEEMFNALCEHCEEKNLRFINTRLYNQIDFPGVLQD